MKKRRKDYFWLWCSVPVLAVLLAVGVSRSSLGKLSITPDTNPDHVLIVESLLASNPFDRLPGKDHLQFEIVKWYPPRSETINPPSFLRGPDFTPDKTAYKVYKVDFRWQDSQSNWHDVTRDFCIKDGRLIEAPR